MSAFEYQALDKQGKSRRGVIEADSPRLARQHLREQGLTPLAVEESARKSARQPRRGGMGATDLALITRQLATLVRAGLALEEALRAVASQTAKPRVKSILLAARSKVLEGHSLADSLNDFPAAFPELYRATVAAGEQSGHLDLVLERLADYTETRQQLRQKTLLALFYPALLTIVALLVVSGLLAYVVPQVVQVFVGLKQELPWLTRWLIALSDFLRTWGAWLLAALFLAAWGIRVLLRQPGPRRAWHHLLLRLPLAGRLSRSLNTARFSRTLSILTASGVPLLEGLRISAQVVDSLPLRDAIIAAAERVREGSSLHSAMERSGLFPPVTVYLIASGETSGNLEEMLERAAANQEREIETVLGVLLAAFEPLLILAMGGVVLVIVMAILLPIFELNRLVK